MWYGVANRYYDDGMVRVVTILRALYHKDGSCWYREEIGEATKR